MFIMDRDLMKEYLEKFSNALMVIYSRQNKFGIKLLNEDGFNPNEYFDLNNENASFDLLNMSIGFFTSMIFAFFTIKLFLKLVEKIGMIPFVAYRFLLGILLLII